MNEKHKKTFFVRYFHWDKPTDMDWVLKIEEENYINDPWPRHRFLNLRHVGCSGAVAQWRDRVIGFAFFDKNEKSLYLVHIAVANDMKHRGVATSIINFLKKKTDNIFFYISESELLGIFEETKIPGELSYLPTDSQLFCTKNKLQPVAIIRDGEENIYEMHYSTSPIVPIHLIKAGNRLNIYPNW